MQYLHYISFQTSTLLSNLNHTWTYGESWYESDGNIRITNNGYLEPLPAYSTPHIPQYELFDWLLNLNIFVEVKPIDDWDHWTYTVLLDGRPLHPFIEIKSPLEVEFDSYYDAMEAGLQVALTNLKQ